MKILERRILHDPGTAFSHIRYGQFSLPCHAHVEFELMYITSGRGCSSPAMGWNLIGPGIWRC